MQLVSIAIAIAIACARFSHRHFYGQCEWTSERAHTLKLKLAAIGRLHNRVMIVFDYKCFGTKTFLMQYTWLGPCI